MIDTTHFYVYIHYTSNRAHVHKRQHLVMLECFWFQLILFESVLFDLILFASIDITHLYVYICYGVATISRLLKIIGLFSRISSLLWGSLANETYDFKEPTDRSHPIH